MVNYGLERDFAHIYAISLTLNRETKFKVAYYKPYTYIPVVFWKDMTIRPRGQGKMKESNSGFQSYDLRLNIWHRSMVQRYCTPFHHKHYCLQYKKDRVKVTDIWFYIEVWYDIFYLKNCSRSLHTLYLYVPDWRENIYGLGKAWTILFDPSIS